jgi:hypothetical protein
LAFLRNISSNGKDAGSQSGANGARGPNGSSASEPDDQTLIAAYRSSSDLKIVAQLYQRYLDLLDGVCLKYPGEPETAKDAVMDIFEENWKKTWHSRAASSISTTAPWPGPPSF